MTNPAASRNWIDRAIEWVSPAAAARREMSRAQIALSRSAGSMRGRDRFSQSYGTTSSVQGGLQADRYALADARDRARNAYAGNVVARSLLTTETDYIVAEGFTYQAHSSDPAWNAEAEDRNYVWLNQCDVSGQRSGTEFQRESWLSPRLDGDGAILRVLVNGYPRLQLVPGDLIQTPYGAYGTPQMYDGIECDPTGRPTFFNIASIDQYGVRKFERVDASNVSFLSHRSTPLALRGMSVLATVFEQLDQLDNYTDSVTKAAIMACIFGLIHKVDSPGQTLSTLGMQPNARGDDQKAISLENGMLRVEGTAGSTYQVQAQQPMNQTPDFIRALMRIICLAFDMPLEIGSRDLSQVSFAGGRIGLLGFYRACRIKAEWIMSGCWRPNTAWWLEIERQRQALGYADAFKTPFPKDYRNFELHGREYEANDRLKEAQADALEISIGKKSPQQIAATSAGDYEMTRDQLKAHYEWCRINQVPITLSTLTRDPGSKTATDDSLAVAEPQ